MRRSAAPGRFLLIALGATAVLFPRAGAAQVIADPVLRGEVLLSDTVLSRGMVVLHRVAADMAGQVDSVPIGPEGSFSFRLPTVPDAEVNEVYFASVRHDGVLYFGGAVSQASQLDSVYVIQTYDTLVAPPTGASLTLQVRNLFLELAGTSWLVTDVFQVRNETGRTIVARDGGAVFRHPLPPQAGGVTLAEAEFAMDTVSWEEGDVVVRAPIPPGPQLFVIRYIVPDPFFDLPVRGVTESLDILVKEPAPPITAPGLTRVDPIEMDPGTTYRRYNGLDLEDTSITLAPEEEPGVPPVRILSVLLALCLAAAGVWALQRGGSGVTVAPAGVSSDRGRLLLEIARLDEGFTARPGPSPEERGAYEAKRRELLRRLEEAR